MFHVQLSRVPGAIAVIALAAAAAGCGTGGTTASGQTAAHSAKAGHPVAGGPAYTAAQLRSALLGSVNGVKPAGPVEAGPYASLQGLTVKKHSVAGVKVTPAKCATASGTGLSSAKFNSAPATVVTFRFKTVEFSEVLLAPPAAELAAAIAHKIPAGCTRYHAVVKGKRYNYRLTEARAPRIGEAASELNVRASGAASANIWTVIYRSHGLVGSVTVVGPGATKAIVDELAKLIYARAQKALA
jgi:hypothetical protein